MGRKVLENVNLLDRTKYGQMVLGILGISWGFEVDGAGSESYPVASISWQIWLAAR